MKRDYFHSAPRSDRRFGEQRNGTCIALIDGRFLIWMAQQGAVGTTGEATSEKNTGTGNLTSSAVSGEASAPHTPANPRMRAAAAKPDADADAGKD